MKKAQTIKVLIDKSMLYLFGRDSIRVEWVQFVGDVNSVKWGVTEYKEVRYNCCKLAGDDWTLVSIR